MSTLTLPKVPDSVSLPFKDICLIIDAFCKEKLNTEYFDLSIKLATKLARKSPSPFLSGSEKTWAAGIIHTLGLVNFLFDKTQSPHLTANDLSLWFELGKTTVSSKSRAIRNMLKIYQMDPDWCLPSRLLDNPFVWLVSFDGYIIDIREAPYDVQQAALEAKVIPFIPPQKKLQPRL